MRYGAVLLVLLGGCSLLTEPQPWPSNVHAIAPATDYATWWQEMEGCSGLSGDFARITWFAADSLLDIPNDGMGAFGYTDIAGKRIALDGRYVDAPWVVRHEMLHILIGKPGHPDQYFGLESPCLHLLAR